MSGLLDRLIKPIVLAEATQYYNSNANNTNSINEVDKVSVDNSFDNVLSSSVSTQASTQNISPGINEVDQVSVDNSFENVLPSSVSAETSPDDLPRKHFPFDKTSRHGHFNEQWYSRLLPDGSRVIRDWLSYSPTLDTVFCLPCMLFIGHNKHKAVTTWTKVGYSTWQNGRQNIMLHEISNIHVNASITLKTKKNSMPIIPALESSQKTNVALNRQIVFEEGWEEKNKGHFKDILLLMAPNSYALFSHINSIKSQGKLVCSFISWERQNQLISSISEFIGSTIRSDIKRSRMFSISIDSTFDAARKEQVSFIIRYVSHSSGNIFERLLAHKESPVTIGESLFDLFELVMDREGLDWKNKLVGQSYDGASNMSLEYKGLQARINAKNNSAIFVWYHAHRLNLVMANAVSSSLDAVDLFGNLESIYSFIWCSKKRAALFR
ncbi:uncharacterized protein LOC132942737 [Metopolophium dirhodum]|uniref:uncharacterized protein LOC132942737 n=1 Tax=Metopolophium dirhodum TaxID=44670 RepID=UPI0029906329|nr:uncharacterized protein LOC132942737 [Metopolophium dirhodum]